VSPPVVVGLVSDTHGLFRPELRAALAGVGVIIHAGDVGGGDVLRQLSEIAPVEAVSGNVDDRRNPLLPRERTLHLGGLTVHVSHGDELGSPRPDLLLARYAGDVLVYGHTHRHLIFRSADNRLVVNSGAAGPRRFEITPSCARLTIANERAEVELIDL
jgi:putative phosphoesterase